VLVYVLVAGLLEATVIAAGAPSSAVMIVGLLISLLVGLEAGTLRRFALNRRGWKSVGLVSGDDLEEAERRFFDAWGRKQTAQSAAGSSAATAPAGAAGLMMRHAAPTPEVIGLFPEPGARQ
jgi:hypothetical protein